MPKVKRKHEIHELVTEWNKIVEVHERNELRQTQIIRRLTELRAIATVQPVPFSVVSRPGQPSGVNGQLTPKPNGALS